MSDRAAALRRLAHDVGKYVARTARNLPAGPVPAVLVEMLHKDLYALDGQRTASAVFEDRMAPLAGDVDPAALARCRALLVEIDALEERVRAGDDVAVRQAAEHALSVSAVIAELVRAEVG